MPSAFSAEYSVFRVCEDHHVIRTADGAEAATLNTSLSNPGAARSFPRSSPAE